MNDYGMFICSSKGDNYIPHSHTRVKLCIMVISVKHPHLAIKITPNFLHIMWSMRILIQSLGCYSRLTNTVTWLIKSVLPSQGDLNSDIP